MVTVTEKDGATIIVIENPTGLERQLIAQAKKLKNGTYEHEMWGKFKCNQKNNTSVLTPANNDMEIPFEEVFSDDEIVEEI